jgi:hypothetical protein
MAVTSIVFTKLSRQWTVDKWDESSQALISHLGIGTGSTAASADDTALVTEVETRGAVTTSQVTSGGVTGGGLQCVGQVAITATRVLREGGLFSASSSGTLYVRWVHDAINLDNGDAIEWTVTISPS